MSRNILYVTVGGLALVLGLLSYMLHKQTDLPPPLSAQEMQEQQARQAELQKKQMAARMQQMATRMKQMSTGMKVPPTLAAKIGPRARMQLQAMLDAARKLKNKKPARNTDLSDDWFTKGQDGAQSTGASDKKRTAQPGANVPATDASAAGR